MTRGQIATKTKRGTRTVPIVGALRLVLLEHKARTGRRDGDLVFGRTASIPFTSSTIGRRALRAWSKRFACGCDVDPKAEPLLDDEGAQLCPVHQVRRLTPIGLHECRHTYVTLMHDAGFSLEEIAPYVGHSSTSMVDRYRHLLDGHEAKTAKRFDDYLTGAFSARRASSCRSRQHG